jgi:hypothetical protein
MGNTIRTALQVIGFVLIIGLFVVPITVRAMRGIAPCRPNSSACTRAPRPARSRARVQGGSKITSSR